MNQSQSNVWPLPNSFNVLIQHRLRSGHTVQYCAQLESCTVCPPLKLLRATLRATVAEVESALTSATSRATVSPCVHHLQNWVQLRDAVSDFRPMNFYLYYWLFLFIGTTPILRPGNFFYGSGLHLTAHFHPKCITHRA